MNKVSIIFQTRMVRKYTIWTNKTKSPAQKGLHDINKKSEILFCRKIAKREQVVLRKLKRL